MFSRALSLLIWRALALQPVWRSYELGIGLISGMTWLKGLRGTHCKLYVAAISWGYTALLVAMMASPILYQRSSWFPVPLMLAANSIVRRERSRNAHRARISQKTARGPGENPKVGNARFARPAMTCRSRNAKFQSNSLPQYRGYVSKDRGAKESSRRVFEIFKHIGVFILSISFGGIDRGANGRKAARAHRHG